MAIQNLVPTEGMIDSDRRRTSIRPLEKDCSEIRPAASLSVIVAADKRGAIGLRGAMLWHIGPDLKRFKAITSGNAVVMGRKTWESLPKRPLPDRLNIVVTRQNGYEAEGARTAASLAEALGIAASCDEIFVIGGGEIYACALPLATRLYLTRIMAEAPEADTFFPAINDEEWTLTESEGYPGGNGVPPFRFENYVRTGSAGE